MSMSPRPALPLRRMAPALLVLLAMAGCAQTGAPAVESARQNSTLEDAQRQAQGRNAARAPSQVQLGFGQKAADARLTAAPAAETAPADNATAAEPAQAPLRELSEPKTFLGTVPCPGNTCQAARISLTLAPSGHWRARTSVLAPSQSQSAEQGCWEAVGMQPTRIVLLLGDRTVRATLGFVNDNVLRVHDIHGAKPALEYRLTRQQDIDPIDELKGQRLPACKAP